MNHLTRRAAARPGRASRLAVTAPSDDPAPAVGRRVCFGLALGAALLLAACGKEAAPPAAARAPAEVGVVTLQQERLDFQAELPGRTSARLAAEVRPQVGGLVRRRLFEEGAQVKAGQVLYELEPASLQASLASANAAVRKAEATLASATTTAKRQAELRRIDAISQQDDDTAQATLQQAQADLGVARATADNARIQLGYARITAPIAGQIGLSTVTPGALVTANQAAAMTTIQQLDPIQVDVTQSSAELLRLRREFDEGRLKRDGDGAARIQVVLEDGRVYPHAGRLTFSGVTVDTGTGSITLRAVVPNPDKLLMPGMYVRARLSEGVDEQALLVPQRAVTRNGDGSATALVVEAGDKLARRRVALGRAVGDRWQVLDGLAAGDRVLIDGMQKARVGDTVRPVPTGGTQPGAAAAAGASGGSAASADLARASVGTTVGTTTTAR